MKFLNRISLAYLTFPFILFALGWLRLSIAIPVTLLTVWAIWKLFAHPPIHYSLFPTPKTTFYLLLITFLWLFFSGIGGYTFQNWDHHWRNAVFHDLIAYDFPVVYSAPEKGPIQMLVYYVGYFLPAAWVGKFLGWGAANFALFLWTWLGVLLVVFHLAHKGEGTSPLRVLKWAFLLIFFSGLDSLGLLFFAKDYPTLFPSIQHLEIWSGNLQYSSFTTQLFWVFNQAVPAWLCVVMCVTLTLNEVKGKGLEHKLGDSSLTAKRFAQNDTIGQLIFIWSLCLFFAPLAALGLLPYLVIEFLKHTDFKSPFKNLSFDVLLASGVIVLVSFLYFSSNTAAQERGLQPIALKDYLAFFLFEGGILWLALAPLKWRDPRWAMTGLLLAVIPFIQLGSGRDFVMRASIAPLFYLMMMTGEAIFQKTTPRLLLITCYLLLAPGSFTPLYEINRSIYRTYEYYFVLDPSQRAQSSGEVITHLEQPGAPEYDHPGSLVADKIQTMKFMDDKLSKNFIANVRQSLFYKYLASH
ncbi:hypothetical protein ANAEL_01646 [Anaerolineales bacterium]|nr:hypothetical protein ANAEL_01646 [Anaerolineales bacterium]